MSSFLRGKSIIEYTHALHCDEYVYGYQITLRHSLFQRRTKLHVLVLINYLLWPYVH